MPLAATESEPVCPGLRLIEAGGVVTAGGFIGVSPVSVAYAGTALYAPAAGGLTLSVVPSVTSVQACVNVGTAGKRGNVGRCAKICGLSRRSITAKIAEYKFDKTAFKEI